MQNNKMPFQNSKSKVEYWQNLALFAFAVFYLSQVFMDVFWNNMCWHIGIDYCAYWSAAYIANHDSARAAYDINLVNSIQQQAFPTPVAPNSAGYSLVVPFIYLPIFLIPFQMINFMGPAASYWVWTLLNLGVLIAYLIFFVKKTTGQKLPIRLLVMLLLSTPVFYNSFSGQTNVWLAVFIGEFFRNLLDDKPVHAGLWLGALMLKPQLLILIGLFLLLQRSIKVLVGFTVSTLAILLASTMMWGLDGFVNIGKILLSFADGRIPIGAEIMMNWRMIGANLSQLLPAWLAWGIALSGMAVSAIFAVIISLKKYDPKSFHYALALLGVLAATGTASWHAHVASALMYFPLLLYLYFSQNQLTQKPLDFWVFIPPFFHLVAIFFGSAIRASVLPGSFTVFFYLFSAVSEFGLNLYLLVWVARRMMPPAQSPATISPAAT